MKNRLVLKASAGTGKTYRLSLEYVGALCRGIDFKDILVMTFTKKATAEIKERILKFLKELAENAKNGESIKENLKKIYPDMEFDYPKISAIYQDLIQNRDKLKVYTIDAFTNLIFKKAIAPYLKIYSYEIIDDDENRKMLIKTFQKIFDNKDDFRAFKGFLEDNSEKDMENYLTLIKNLLNERWKVIVLGEKLKEKREALTSDNNYKHMDRIVEILERISKIKDKSLEELFKTSLKKYLLCKDENEKEAFILEKNGDILEKEIWNGVKVKSKKGDIDSELEDMKYIYGELKDNLAKTMYNNSIIPYEEKLLYILNRIYEVYDDIKFKEKRFTHSDISSYTFKYIRDKELNFINENGVTDEFFEILDGKIDTIFIDEFQDTSILQWKILKDIIDQTNNVICVGDEKQSIYGWRGGEKKLFENLEKIIDGKEEKLFTCFRSEKNIVSFTNMIFSNISKMSENEEFEGESWNFYEVNSKSDDIAGHIEILRKKTSEEVTVIDQIIKKIKEDFNKNYKGIGILGRTNKELDMIAEKLSEADIPYVIDSNSNIVDYRGINGLFSLINYLVKDDYLSLLDFFRSDLINIGVKTLKYMIKNRKDIEKYLNMEDTETALNGTELTVLETVRDIKKEYMENNGETSFLTYNILKKVGIGGKFNSKSDISNIYSFYKIIKNYKYFEEFIVEFEDKKNSDKFKKMVLEDDNSVNIMTIHKSKGLEFDTLFYYYNPSSRGSSRGNVRFFLKMDKDYNEPESFLITHDKFKKIIKSLGKEYDYLNDIEIKEKHEEINNLYVALTRPKNNLYIAVENDKESIFSEALFLSENTIQDSDIVFSKNDKGTAEGKKREFTVDLSTPEAEYPEAEESMEKEREKIYSHALGNEIKRVRGTTVHFFLENIMYGTSEEIALAKELTFSKFASVIGEKTIKELLADEVIEYILNKNKKIFSDEWDFIFPEYEVFTDEKTYRIDRLMVKMPVNDSKGTIYIVDYKTGDTDEDQMENYKYLIEKLLEDRKMLDKFEIITEFIEFKL
ncbi:putative ATP-dependent nuclease [Fusobacterium varium]|nr:putative ATP-dependent nuclease [Fusobacterium varium]